MTYVEKPIHRPEHASQVCNICGKPARKRFAKRVPIWLRADALDRKKHEEKPNS